jgi:hypothetical protein
MVQLRKINPMVRAVGTMGAVAAVAGGITFAALTSNTVALSANTLSSATAHLLIGTGGSGGEDTTCSNTSDKAIQGMNLKLVPGQKSDDFDFCLKNDGDVPLDITSSIAAADLFESPIPASGVMLDITCDNEGAVNASLAQFVSGAQSLGTLDADDSTNCTANATLKADYDGSGKTVKPFTLNFVGTQADDGSTDEPGQGTSPGQPTTPGEDQGDDNGQGQQPGDDTNGGTVMNKQ